MIALLMETYGKEFRNTKGAISHSKQLINSAFNAIHSGKDTVKQWYC